ncbi:MAG: hypothetical protein C0599_04530 [Salinivirgaceae bacterium]|nr:MAG: hypothetical protein C0599_04530 [Salinivirgaceae bacterium]
MQKLNHFILFLVVFFPLTLFSQIAIDYNKSHEDDTVDILFIGSSYFGYHNLPGIFDSLSSAAGYNVRLDSHIPGGWYLDDHATDPETDSLINERNWDYVILQGVGSLMAYPNVYTSHPVYPAIDTLKGKILSNCSSTEIIYCLPWAFEDGMTWLGWDDTYADMQELIYETTLSYCNDLEISIAPVGWAWYEVLDSLNYPLHYLHLSDWNHPSVRGSYLMGCVVYVSVFMESIENNPYYFGLAEQEALGFQQVASDIVLNDLVLWNLADSVPNGVLSQTVCSNLFDVYPNPIEKLSTITFSISKPGNVKLSIVNINGEIVKVIENRYFASGTYFKMLDFSTNNEGLYLLILEHNQHKTFRKIVYEK